MNMNTLRAPAAVPSRIITPALAKGSVAVSELSRAIRLPFPDSGWCTKRNSSAVLQMSTPEPFTVNLQVVGRTPTSPKAL